MCKCSECKEYLAFLGEKSAPLETINEDVEMEIIHAEKKSEPPKIAAPVAPAFPPQPVYQYPLYNCYHHVPNDACFAAPPFYCPEYFELVQR
mmetsp:Transcript_9985/g.15347  ORF Transcript_9985/g.15347 Transcript_9985/m.15347 type:complete len:92 (-) Transcript_9985:124-399(-)